MSCANPCAPQKIASLSRRKSIVSVQKPVAAKPKQPAPIRPAQAKNGANQKGKPQTGAGAKPEQTKQKSESNVDSSKDLSRAIGSNILLVGTLLISGIVRSEEHTSELQSLMRISYAVLCLKKKHNKENTQHSKRTI